MATEQNALLLIDNDAFVLLAGSGHLEAVLDALGLPLDNARYNAPFPYVFAKHISKSLPPSVVERVENAIKQIKPLEFAPSPATQQQLQQVHEIDVGEAVLFGVLADHPTTLLTTNDKRALRALSTTPSLAEIRDAVRGRIIAVESIIRRLVDAEGVEPVAQGFVEVMAIDTRLAVIFSEHNRAHPDQCREAIEIYLRHAIEQCGEGFFHPFLRLNSPAARECRIGF